MSKVEVTDIIEKISEAKQKNPQISFMEFIKLMVQEAVLPPEMEHVMTTLETPEGEDRFERDLRKMEEKIADNMERGLRIRGNFDRKLYEMDQRTTKAIRGLKKDYRPLVDDIKDLE